MAEVVLSLPLDNDRTAGYRLSIIIDKREAAGYVSVAFPLSLRGAIARAHGDGRLVEVIVRPVDVLGTPLPVVTQEDGTT